MQRCRAMSRFNTMRMMGQLRDERWEPGEDRGEETRSDGDGMVSQWATKLETSRRIRLIGFTITIICFDEYISTDI
ncbi:unnamed protein product [Boreogadus saida]